MKKQSLIWPTAIVAAMLFVTAPAARAQHPFDWVGGAAGNWTSAANWSDVDEFTFYPGQRASDAVPIINDIANVATANAALSINAGETVTIGVLNLNANGISINGAGTLQARLLPLPPATALPELRVNVGANTGTSLNSALSGSLIFGVSAGNSIDINGEYTSAGHTLRADTGTVNFNAAIHANSGTTTIRTNTDAAAVLNFNAAIDGAGSVLYFGRGTFNHTVDNTYLGSTILGTNSPNVSAVHVISTDAAFSTGAITFTGQTSSQIIQGDGTGARTLANGINISRDATFAGTDQITLTGDVRQTSSRALINNIAGNNLNITGRLFAANSNDGRILLVGGSGTTRVSAAVYDRYDTAAANQIGTLIPDTNRFGALGYNGTGRMVLDSSFQANYTGWTDIRDGVVQLGTGGAAVALNGSTIAGSASTLATIGTLEINQNTSLTLGTLNGALNINSVGGGDVTLASTNFGTGTITARDGGTVYVHGGTFAGSTIAQAIRPLSNQLVVNTAEAAGLMRGQTLTVSGVNNSVAFSNEVFVTDLHDLLDGNWSVDVSGNISTAGDSIYQIVAAAGSGTGLRNATANGGIIAGNGVIGGNLTVAPTAGSSVAPGASIGTLTVNGNANVLGAMEIEFNGSAPQAIDLLAVGGNLSLGAASTLNLLNVGGDLTDASYVFATYGGTLSGTFANIVGLNLQPRYRINYAFNGNSIALVAVPEPSSLMLLVPVALLAARRRRRQVG